MSMRARAIGLAMIAAVAIGASGCGGGESDRTSLIQAIDSSWVQGQASLTTSPGFLSIATRAQTLGDKRLAERQRELALLEAARVAAKKHAREAQLRAYLEAKRRAEAAYRAALRRAAIARARALAKLRQLQRQRAEALRKLNEKLHVPTGEECADPVVRQHVRCRPGKLPTKQG